MKVFVSSVIEATEAYRKIANHVGQRCHAGTVR